MEWRGAGTAWGGWRQWKEGGNGTRERMAEAYGGRPCRERNATLRTPSSSSALRMRSRTARISRHPSAMAAPSSPSSPKCRSGM
eukprot:372326-Rhodomonas_salina.2